MERGTDCTLRCEITLKPLLTCEVTQECVVAKKAQLTQSEKVQVHLTTETLEIK